jgi:hypothetical protein
MTEFLSVVVASMIGTMFGTLIVTWIWINCDHIKGDD